MAFLCLLVFCSRSYVIFGSCFCQLCSCLHRLPLKVISLSSAPKYAREQHCAGQQTRSGWMRRHFQAAKDAWGENYRRALAKEIMKIDVDKMCTVRVVKEMRLFWVLDSWKNTRRNELGMISVLILYVTSNGDEDDWALDAATASREGGWPAPATPLLRVYFLGNYGWCCFECGVVAVMHCLRCSAFSLARLLSQLNHAETPTSPQDDHRSTSGCSPSHTAMFTSQPPLKES